MSNGFCESFDDRMRDKLLNETLFLNPAQALLVVAVLGKYLQPGENMFVSRAYSSGGVRHQTK